MELSEKLKKIRKEKKITQAELARKSGLSKTYISLIERGNQGVRVDTLNKIAKALEVPFEELYQA